MTKLVELPATNKEKSVIVLRVNGPLFFAAAEKIFDELIQKSKVFQTIILQWDTVSVLDAGGLSALGHFIEQLPADKQLMICDLQFQPLKALARATFNTIEGRIALYSSVNAAFIELERQQEKTS